MLGYRRNEVAVQKNSYATIVLTVNPLTDTNILAGLTKKL